MNPRKLKTATMPNLPSPIELSISCRRSFRFAVLVVSLFATFVVAPILCAQDATSAKKPAKPYSLIFGTVWGPDDRPVYGVRVRIRRAADKKAHWEQFSDHRGEFGQRLPPGPGDYVIWADLHGFKPLTGKQLSPGEEIKVHIDNEERQDIGLHLK